ncbi:MAG TPA: hypothetical protein VK665_07355, partial [Candidatus Elarobacter sp.]|nr:hypothetical protein [Candidatus Elarobacter sp.]
MTRSRSHEGRSLRALPWIAAGATLVFHLIANPHYGFFRDELYFIMCGFRYIINGWNAERILIAAECVGHGRFLVERAAAY